MASVSDITSSSVILLEGSTTAPKPKRRSSIFRPDITASRTIQWDYEINKFPPNYADKLTQENVKWKETFANLKTECLKLKEQTRQTAPSCYTDVLDYEHYVKKAEDFFCQMSNITEMHENINNLRNIRRKELKILMDSARTQMHENVTNCINK